MTALPDLDLDLAANVATRVRGLMAEQRLNQGHVARVLNVSRSGVSERLSGGKDFDLKELPALAELLGESIEYLLGLTDVRKQKSPAPIGGGSLFLASEVVRHQGLEPRTRCFGDRPLTALPPGHVANVLPLRRSTPARRSA